MCCIIYNRACSNILTIKRKPYRQTWNISIEKTNQGFGKHGLVTTATGHGVTTHAQVTHGARIGTTTAVGAAAY